MELLISFCFFLLLFFTVAPVTESSESSCSAQVEAATRELNASKIHLLLHHPRSPCSPAPHRHLPYFDILRHDALRAASLSHRLTAPSASAVSVPLSQGTALGVGNYVARIGLGTPPKSFAVVVDTGSSLSWLQCLPCKVSCHHQVGPIFNPDSSTTYRPVSCSAASCSALTSATLNPSACSHSGTCIYEATYGDSSFSVGYLSQDTLSLSGSSVPGFVFGCGQDNEGLFGESAGLIGLAKNGLSLLSQLGPRFGSIFSYCLPTSSGTGYLSFGDYNHASLSFTPIVKSSIDRTLYFLKLTGITVARRKLAVSETAYAGTPTIIDSGTVITRLPMSIYTALSDAVVAAIGEKHPRAEPYSILDTCFKGSAAGLGAPEVSLVYAGGAVMQLPARNVLIDVDKGRTCLAFASAGGVAIIGNRQQQTFSVVYDVGKGRIGFAAGGCG